MTSLSSRSELRWAACRSARCSVACRKGCAKVPSIGPIIECQRGTKLVTDVGKKVVLARSISASASARLRSASKARASAMFVAMCLPRNRGKPGSRIEDAARPHAGDQSPRVAAGSGGQREHKGSLDRVRPWTGGDGSESGGQIGYLARPAGLRDRLGGLGWLTGAVDDRMALGETRRTIVLSRPGDASALVPSSSSR